MLTNRNRCIFVDLPIGEVREVKNLREDLLPSEQKNFLDRTIESNLPRVPCNLRRVERALIILSR
jgi:hypothetical protein